MSFNLDSTKQTQEVIFSRKQAKSVHPALVFNNTPVHQTHFQKHLGLYLNIKLNFKLHFKEIVKAMKRICIIKKLSNILAKNRWLQFINILLGLPLITMMWYLINQIMKSSDNKLKMFNIMPPLQWVMLLKEYPDLNYTMK